MAESSSIDRAIFSMEKCQLDIYVTYPIAEEVSIGCMSLIQLPKETSIGYISLIQLPRKYQLDIRHLSNCLCERYTYPDPIDLRTIYH